MSAAHKVDVAIIGAGVIGLACARSLAMKGKEVLILERASSIGSETSSRNSEVIHAGLYYPRCSLKRKFCVEGKNMIYDYCKSRGINHKRIGKVVVSTTKEERQTDLVRIRAKAERNGVHDLKLLSSEDVEYLEPELRATGGIFSPSTGILDSHELMLSFLSEAEQHGAILALHCPVDGGCVETQRRKILLRVQGMELLCSNVINCAGLHADHLCGLILSGDRSSKSLLAGPSEHSAGQQELKAGDTQSSCCVSDEMLNTPRHYFAKGNYFKLTGQSTPFRHLIYPIPEPGGLGIHATLDLSGSCRFGPDVEWIDRKVTNPDKIEMKVDADRVNKFYEQIRKYWPNLKNGALIPDYSGIRPKLGHPDFLTGPPIQSDFVLEGPQDHGIPGFVSMLAIESPGLTSCMALAEHVSKIVQ